MPVHRTVLLRPVERDYASSGQGTRKSVALVAADGTVIVNSVGEVEWKVDGFQILLCDACGVEGCESGGWVASRRYGSAIAWVPALGLIGRDRWTAVNYAPPPTGSHLFFGEAAFEVARRIPDHPDAPELRDLTVAEATAVLQARAPGHILGHLGEPLGLDPDVVVAADPESAEVVVRAIRELLHGPDLVLQPPSDLAVPLDLYLDLSGTPVWTPICREPDGRIALLPFGRASLPFR